MAYAKSRVMAGLNALPRDEAPADSKTTHLADLMADPSYLRHSSALINEALQKGFDVLHLANGDIVTTGTKTIVHTYSWDKDAGKLVRQKPSAKSRKGEAREELIVEDD